MFKANFVLLMLFLQITLAAFAQQNNRNTHLLFPTDRNVVQLPFERINSWIVIKGSINGSGGKTFILDTGAPVAVLVNDSNVADLNLSIKAQVVIGGGDGNTGKKTPLASGVRVQFGDIIVENANMVVGAAKDAVHGIDGIIGKYLFDGAIVKIDWQQQIITFYKEGTFSYNGDGVELPLEMDKSGHIYTKASFKGPDTTIECKALVDLGNKSSLFIDKKAAAGLAGNNKVIKDIIIGWGANGQVNGSVTRTSLLLPGVVLDNVVIALKDKEDNLSKKGYTANIGLSVLQRFTLYFDYQGKKLILEKNKDFSSPFLFNRSGIIINPRPSEIGLIVAFIIPGSPAAKAGVVAGDIIISADGNKNLAISINEIEPLIKGWKKDSLQLQLIRQNTTQHINLSLKDLL